MAAMYNCFSPFDDVALPMVCLVCQVGGSVWAVAPVRGYGCGDASVRSWRTCAKGVCVVASRRRRLGSPLFCALDSFCRTRTVVSVVGLSRVPFAKGLSRARMAQAQDRALSRLAPNDACRRVPRGGFVGAQNTHLN